MKTKLQFRVTILIASLSLLMIFVFTTIQLRNHLERLRSYNRYRARVGTIIVKTTMETLIKSIPSEEMMAGIFKAAVSSFSKEEVVEKISVISMSGDVVATNDPLVEKFGETKKDIDTYRTLSKSAGQNTWFFSIMNQRTQNIDIYIPISTSSQNIYIAKLSFSIANIQRAFFDILVPISLTAIAVIVVNIILGFILSRTVVRPIKILNSATKDIASGNLERRVEIRTGDEIQELGRTFNIMTVELKKMHERAQNANPLTSLPGNNMIREEIENRIKKNLRFVAIYSDLDNFKAFNDNYGIAKGDEVIKCTGEILKNVIKEKGNLRDFVGHEGGDDFYLITTPEKADGIAKKIINDFDSKIRDFYSEEDRKRGGIRSKDRKGRDETFPIMTISLAGISNASHAIKNYGELTNIAVEVKHKAKEVQKSNFVMDHRKT